MNPNKHSISILHRPSRRINRVALSAAYSRADKRNQATAGPSYLQTPNFPLIPCPAPIIRLHSSDPNNRTVDRDQCAVRPSHVSHQETRIFKPRSSIYLGAFNVRTLMQAGQQAALALTLDSLNIDVCCVSETRIQDPTTYIDLTAPALRSSYRLRTSGDPRSQEAGYAGVGIALSARAEAALVEWIPVNSRLCAVRLLTSTRIRNPHRRHRCVFVISAYAPTDCSSDLLKDAFYQELDMLLGRAKGSDIVILAGDINAQVGRLSPTENQLGGQFALNSRRNDNGDRLLHICASRHLFLSSTAFRRTGRRTATWRPANPVQPWTQIDHVAISYRWRGSITDCRSFWSTYVDSDHALVRFRFTLRFPGRVTLPLRRLNISKLNEPEVKQIYQSELEVKLSSSETTDVTSSWNHISKTMHDAAASVCGFTGQQNHRHWISEDTMNLLERRKEIPAGREYNSIRRDIRRQLKVSVRKDREAWWTRKVQEMESAHSAGNARLLFRLIRETGPKSSTVSETIRDKNSTVITDRKQRLRRWAEYFEGQFSWPPTSRPLVSNHGNIAPWAVSLDAPTESEVQKCLDSLKRHRAAGPDNLVPALFKDGGSTLCTELTRLFGMIWDTETVPDNWGHSIIVPIYKSGDRMDCGNYRGISLTPVITRLLASVILRRLEAAREAQIREQQAGFRRGRGCIDNIFTLRQVLELRHVYHRPTIAVFLDFKGAFDSVDRSSLMHTLLMKGVPEKFVNILRALYAHTSGCIRVYGQMSDDFPTVSGVRQGCPLSPFLFNFVIDMIIDTTLQGLDNPGIDIMPGEKLVDLEYADDIVLLFDTHHSAQSMLDRMSEVIEHFGMRFSPHKCKVMLQDLQASILPLKLQGEDLAIVDKFTYLGSCISQDGTVTNEISARIAKARITFANLRHLWRQKGISLQLKGRVYKTTVRAVLLYGCETWPIRADDLKRLQIFDHRCLRSIARIGWNQRIRNERIRKIVFGDDKFSSLEQQIKIHRTRWLGHVLRMPSNRLPHKALYAIPKPEWRRTRGGQPMTWKREMKNTTAKLGSVGSVRLPGWGPRDAPNTWLETLRDMAMNRTQWRTCCHALALNSC